MESWEDQTWMEPREGATRTLPGNPPALAGARLQGLAHFFSTLAKLELPVPAGYHLLHTLEKGEPWQLRKVPREEILDRVFRDGVRRLAYDPFARLALTIHYYCGTRATETSDLHLFCVLEGQDGHAYLLIPRGKSKQERPFPIVELGVGPLLEYMDEVVRLRLAPDGTSCTLEQTNFRYLEDDPERARDWQYLFDRVPSAHNIKQRGRLSTTRVAQTLQQAVLIAAKCDPRGLFQLETYHAVCSHRRRKGQKCLYFAAKAGIMGTTTGKIVEGGIAYTVSLEQYLGITLQRALKRRTYGIWGGFWAGALAQRGVASPLSVEEEIVIPEDTYEHTVAQYWYEAPGLAVSEVAFEYVTQGKWQAKVPPFLDRHKIEELVRFHLHHVQDSFTSALGQRLMETDMLEQRRFLDDLAEKLCPWWQHLGLLASSSRCLHQEGAMRSTNSYRPQNQHPDGLVQSRKQVAEQHYQQVRVTVQAMFRRGMKPQDITVPAVAKESMFPLRLFIGAPICSRSSSTRILLFRGVRQSRSIKKHSAAARRPEKGTS